MLSIINRKLREIEEVEQDEWQSEKLDSYPFPLNLALWIQNFPICQVVFRENL